MTKFGSGARIAIADGNPNLCAAIQDSLIKEGHPDAIICHSGEALIQAIDGQFFDLLVIDDDLPGLDIVNLIQRIRRQSLGKNPYVGIIATISSTRVDAAKAAIDAGVDELTPKPLNVDRLFARVSSVVQRRRPFVIAPDYVGPTRRKVERDSEPMLVRDIPNSLRSVIVDMAGRSEIEKQVTRAAERLADNQFDAAVREVDRLVTSIAGSYGTEIVEDEWRRSLQRLIVIADTMQACYAGPSKQVVADLAGMLTLLARRILNTSPWQRVIEVDLLVQLNQAVPASLDVNHRDLRAFREISKMIGGFMASKEGR